MKQKLFLQALWHNLGPGILLAATSIGASHLVMSPQAGALYDTRLLWLVLASHIFKYPAFELGPRYAAVTGRSLVEGYFRVPGPRGWALWLFLLGTVLQGIGVLGGVVSVSGAVLHCWFGPSTEWFSLVVAIMVLFLLFCGGFSWLDDLNKLMMAVLALATLFAFCCACPPPEKFSYLIVPSLPDGSLVLVAAILGWMPTGIDVSVWHSFWTLEKFKRLGIDKDDASRIRERLSLQLYDMRLGYGLSLITALMFMCMGASLLTGQGERLRGAEFASALAGAYSLTLGSWMEHVFMLTAFFAMFSTSYTVVDGFSRSFSEGLSTLFPRLSKSREKLYFGFATFSTLLAVVLIFFAGNPVVLVTTVALLSLAAAPLLYGLNIYCAGKQVSDPSHRPPRWLVVLGWAGVAFMLLAFAATATSLLHSK